MSRIILVAFCIIGVLNANNVTLITEELLPYQFKDNDKKLQGISVDIVNAIQKELNINNKIKILPWMRGLKLIEKKPNHALFSMLKTKDRTDKYKWVGPIAQMKIVFFKKADSNIKINSIEDAKSVTSIGVSKGVANEEILKNMGFKNLNVTVGHEDKVMKKLIKGKIDLWPYLYHAGLYKSKTLIKSEKITPLKNVVLFQGPLYIAFSKYTNDSVINQWQNSLNKLIENGTIDKINDNYK